MKLQEIMNKKKLSQGRLAQRAGVSQPCISQLISGKKAPTLPTLEKIATALGVSVGELIGEQEKHKAKAG